MYRLVYFSAATTPFTKAQLMALLKKAREKNERLGITGMLLYKEGDFLQLLEGERSAVEALFRVIETDPRHKEVFVALEEATDARLFDQWSMGFRDLHDPELPATPGFSPCMNTPLVANRFKDHPSDALQLLAMFKPKF